MCRGFLILASVPSSLRIVAKVSNKLCHQALLVRDRCGRRTIDRLATISESDAQAPSLASLAVNSGPSAMGDEIQVAQVDDEAERLPRNKDGILAIERIH